MKIIKKRSPLEDWRLEVDCKNTNWRSETAHCGSTLEIDINDLIKRKWNKYPDYEGINYGFICPVCGNFTDINEALLTDEIKKMAKEYTR